MSSVLTSFKAARCQSARGQSGTATSRSSNAAEGLVPTTMGNKLHQKRSSSMRVRASEGDDGSVEEVDVVVGNQGVLASNPAFAAVFKGAMQRRGKSALLQNTRPEDENKPSPGEEVLLQALRQSRRNILRLEELKDSIEGAIEIETKQFERIQFGLKRATADAAFIRTLQKLRKQSQQTSE